jgi:hypothetical protein
VALLLGAVGGWLVITLPYGVVIHAGWRHEMYSSLLGALAIFGGTLAQGRRWPQRTEAYGALGVLCAMAVLVAPLPKLLGLVILSVVLAAGGVVAFASEAAAKGRGPFVAHVAVVVGILDLMTITPMFVFLDLSGALRPPL